METVNLTRKECARGDVTTNTVAGFFGLLKRGINGTYHQVSKKHLHRYVAEFEFRYNARKITDGQRTDAMIAGFEGKRLKYRTDLGEAAMARARSNKKATRKANARKKPEDTTVKVPVSFEDAVKALLGTKPPKNPKK